MPKRGDGSVRERRPGVWEIRVATGRDVLTGRTTYRSVTFHGVGIDAKRYAQELAAEYRARRSVATAAPMLTVAELIERWLAADHPWKSVYCCELPIEREGDQIRRRTLADAGRVDHTEGGSSRDGTLVTSGRHIFGGRRQVSDVARRDWMGLRRTRHRRASDSINARPGTAVAAPARRCRSSRTTACCCGVESARGCRERHRSSR